MSSAITDSSPIDYLIALKSHFEQELSEADAKVASLREQLQHVDALLLNQLVPAHGVAPLQEQNETPTPELFLSAQVDFPNDRLDLHPAQDDPETTATTSEISETTTQPEPAPEKDGRSNPRELQPAYQELTRLEAIFKVLNNHQGQAVTLDTLTQELFGTLSEVDHKAEVKRLKPLLYKGEKQELWQKGKKPSSYRIKGSAGKRKEQSSKKGSAATSKTAAATTVTQAVQPTVKAAAKTDAQSKTTQVKPETTAKPRVSLPLLPEFEGKTKQEAIVSVLEQNSGEMLHHDEIIQLIYGNLSNEDHKAERKRMITALHRGVSANKWQKGSAPASYQLASTPKNTKSKSTGRKSKPSKPQSESVPEAVAEKAPDTTATSAAEKPQRGRKTPAKAKAKTSRQSATGAKKKAKV